MRLLLAGQVQVAVHGTDHQIQTSQDGIGQIESPVPQDDDLDPLEQDHALEPFVEPVDRIDLRGQSRRIQSMGHGQAA